MTDTEVILSPSVTATRTGLIFSNGISYDEWQQIGVKLKELRGMVHWWIGDWLNYGEAKWGEMYTQVYEETGYTEHTLANDKYIAREFPASRRRDKLTWSHHQAVASLEPVEQDRLLDIAEAMDLKRDKFRALITERKEVVTFFERLSTYPREFGWAEEKTARFNSWLAEGREFFTESDGA